VASTSAAVELTLERLVHATEAEEEVRRRAVADGRLSRLEAALLERSGAKKLEASSEASFNLYKILCHFKALLWESIILLLPPPHL